MPDSPFTAIGDEPVEARIVSWVLGEASAFESAELERLCEERPELLVFRRRMRALHGLLTEAEAAQPDEGWKLPEEKRKALDEIFGAENIVRLEAQKETRIRHSGRKAILAIAACLVLTLVVLRLMPWKQVAEAEATIEVEPRSLGVPLGQMMSENNVSNQATPQFFATEVDKIKSRNSLEKVVENLELTQRWGVDKETALARLKSSVKTQNIRGTDLISIKVQDANETDAKDIADQVTKNYVAYRSEIENKAAEAAIHELNKAVRDQEDKVEERRKVLSTIVRTKGIIYKGTDSFYGQSGVNKDEGNNEDDTREEAIKRGLDAQDYVDAKREFETDQELLQQMKLKQIGENITRKMSINSVEVHDRPVAAKKNVSALDAVASNVKGWFSEAKPSEKMPEKKVNFMPAVAGGKGEGFGGGGSDVTLPESPHARGESFARTLPQATPATAAKPEAQAPAAETVARASRPKPAVAMLELAPGETPAPLNNAGSGTLSFVGGAMPSDAPQKPVTNGPRSGDASVASGEIDVRRNDIGDDEVAKAMQDREAGESNEARKGLETALKANPEDETVARASCPPPTEAMPEKAAGRMPVPLTDEISEAMPEKAAGRMPVPLTDEISSTEEPYSTFSLNISDASFQVAQAALAKGERPAPAGIKVEQFYNAVDYGDPAPGANEPVAVNIEQTAHPVIPGRNLVRIALKTAAAGRSAAQPLRLTLLVDQSGSMVREDRRAAMEKALASLTGLLTDKDRVTVIGFSRTPRLLADAMVGDQAAKLAELVNQSASEGGTNLEEAIKLGEQLAGRHKLAGAQNRIVLFTDGAANLGNADPARLAEKVKQLRQKGVSFDIAGIAADGLNDELLGELARNGNGRYYVVGKGADDDFGKQLAGAFRPAAENVKVQVHFNPERVGRYKLIGFEKDRLKTEDFRNDKVDAAELAAEEAGVAVYQVETLPEGNGELGEVSVRFRDAASGEMVERGWTIPHDDKAPALDRATPSMQLATLAMFAAEKLKGGPLGEAIDFKQLAEPQANVKRYYGNNVRIGEVLRMIDALR